MLNMQNSYILAKKSNCEKKSFCVSEWAREKFSRKYSDLNLDDENKDIKGSCVLFILDMFCSKALLSKLELKCLSRNSSRNEFFAIFEVRF